ncbi:MAG: Zn finger-containing GTPase- Activating Protein for ARF [Vezdaea acicularis]|nr:MAG: Zn finger-containing GTPase- Activating Protein for ARF [Vezdaea acicularis]
MDAFKQAEILRMQHGGNNAWKNFYENHSATKLTGVGWDDSTVAERYSGEVGEEWKERLSAKVEGKEYVPQEKSKAITSAQGSNRPSRTTSIVGSRSGTPAGVNRAKMADSVSSLRSSSPTPSLGTSSIGGSKKAQNEAYFASLGSANASRPADLPPSQGGKFTGFGSAPPGPTEQEHAEASLPGLDDLQKDPVAALTRGFGWFTTTVGKTAKTVNEDWVQPTAQKLVEADLATQARLTAAQLGQNITSTTKNTADTFNRFVDTQGAGGTSGLRRTQRSAPIDESKKDFWDSFGAPDEPLGAPEQKSKPNSIGTAAMRKGGIGATGGKKKDEGWEEDGWEKF